jgi:hypothetical protein
MMRIVAILAFSLAVALGTSGEAAADSNAYCGSSENGCAHSMTNTPCAGHGSFGAFGKDNDWRGGASGDNTAYNNSTLCGNPQGAAGVDE